MFGTIKWANPMASPETFFLNDAGDFTIELRTNVIVECVLLYAGGNFPFLLAPGQNVEVLIEKKGEEGWKFRALENQLINSSLKFKTKFIHEDPKLHAHYDLQNVESLDALLNSISAAERYTRNRLKKISPQHASPDPTVMRWADNFIDYHFKRDAYFFGLLRTRDPAEQLAMVQRVNFPGYPLELREKQQYGTAELGYVECREVENFLTARLATDSLPEAERSYRRYEENVRLAGKCEMPFTADFLLARLLYQSLSAPKLDGRILADAKSFVECTSYPALAYELAQHIAIVSGEGRGSDLAARISELPATAENPIPAILERNAGKVVVIDIWATWCGPCIYEMEHAYPALIEKYAAEDVAFIFLARACQRNLWEEYIAKLRFEAQHYLTDSDQDAVMNKLFGISGIPHHIVFDKAGTLVQGHAPGPGRGLEEIISKHSAPPAG